MWIVRHYTLLQINGHYCTLLYINEEVISSIIGCYKIFPLIGRIRLNLNSTSL